MKILIVEDNRIISLILGKMVESMDHEIVDTVNTGETAVEIATENAVDLVLMDIMLEGELNGIQAMKKIQAVKDMPVIYVTGNSDPSTIKQAKETNYMGYLIKPVNFESLKHLINRMNGEE